MNQNETSQIFSNPRINRELFIDFSESSSGSELSRGLRASLFSSSLHNASYSQYRESFRLDIRNLIDSIVLARNAKAGTVLNSSYRIGRDTSDANVTRIQYSFTDGPDLEDEAAILCKKRIVKGFEKAGFRVISPTKKEIFSFNDLQNWATSISLEKRSASPLWWIIPLVLLILLALAFWWWNRETSMKAPEKQPPIVDAPNRVENALQTGDNAGENDTGGRQVEGDDGGNSGENDPLASDEETSSDEETGSDEKSGSNDGEIDVLNVERQEAKISDISEAKTSHVVIMIDCDDDVRKLLDEVQSECEKLIKKKTNGNEGQIRLAFVPFNTGKIDRSEIRISDRFEEKTPGMLKENIDQLRKLPNVGKTTMDEETKQVMDGLEQVANLVQKECDFSEKSATVYVITSTNGKDYQRSDLSDNIIRIKEKASEIRIIRVHKKAEKLPTTDEVGRSVEDTSAGIVSQDDDVVIVYVDWPSVTAPTDQIRQRVEEIVQNTGSDTEKVQLIRIPNGVKTIEEVETSGSEIYETPQKWLEKSDSYLSASKDSKLTPDEKKELIARIREKHPHSHVKVISDDNDDWEWLTTETTEMLSSDGGSVQVIDPSNRISYRETTIHEPEIDKDVDKVVVVDKVREPKKDVDKVVVVDKVREPEKDVDKVVVVDKVREPKKDVDKVVVVDKVREPEKDVGKVVVVDKVHEEPDVVAVDKSTKISSADKATKKTTKKKPVASEPCSLEDLVAPLLIKNEEENSLGEK